MLNRIKKHHFQIGAPPGTMILNPEEKAPSIKIFDYDRDQYVEKDHATIEDCLISIDTTSITWIHISGYRDPKMLQTFGTHFTLHPLLLEDITTSSERSKLEDYKDNLFIVLRMLLMSEEKNEVYDEQVNIILGKNYVITLIEQDRNIFQPIFERIRKGKNRIRSLGADYLAYAIIDIIVDNYFIILEKIDEGLEKLEGELVNQPKPSTLQKIQTAKRQMALLRKSVWPVREVISQFRRLETELIQYTTHTYMHDVYDHTIQAIDTIEGFRDIVGGMLEIYLSNISQRLNEIMKFLTVVSTIFTPLTFLASLYGMNFISIPGLQWKGGFYLMIACMTVVAIALLHLFRRKKWI